MSYSTFYAYPNQYDPEITISGIDDYYTIEFTQPEFSSHNITIPIKSVHNSCEDLSNLNEVQLHAVKLFREFAAVKYPGMLK